jgi:hypothetical protein
MRLGVLDATDGTSEIGLTSGGTPIVVESIDSASTFTVVANAATAQADNDIYYIWGNYNKEVTGLLAMIAATGTYQTINRATSGNERWKSNVVTGAGDITEEYMQQVDSACEKASGQKPNLILGTYEARDRYAAILAADRRFVNTLEMKGGFKGPEFHGRPLIPDPECPRGHLFFLNTNYIAIYQQAGLRFMDEDGSILSRASGYAAYEAVLYWFLELGSRRCNVHGRLSGCNQ